jgi:hypothetical protein
MMPENLLSHQPPSSQHQIRAELEAMVLGDLLGPAGGEAEELTERTVRDRYLVGVLAPSRGAKNEGGGTGKSSNPPLAPNPSSPDVEEDEEIPLIPDELSEGGSDTADDGNTDTDTPVVQAHLPSSIGMSFCVDGEAKAIQVSASWGQYKREQRDTQQDFKGNSLKVWQRYPRGGRVTIPLQEGPITAHAPDPEFPDVYLQGQVRRRNAQFIVTLFLVNAQEELRPKDEFHIFQPKLTATGEDGQAVFWKRPTLGNNHDLEERLMAMLYRQHVEFAVGHGVSVHAEVAASSPDKATRIETRIIPTYEVPRTAPPTAADAADNPAFGKLAGLVLDMKVLAESDARKLPRQLEPLVVAYREWIEREAARLNDPHEGVALRQFGDAASVAIDHCRLTLQRIEEGLALLTQDSQACDAFLFMNRAMWLQRTHSIYSERVRRGEQPDFDRDIDEEPNRSWRPFQLAFILLNLPGVTRLDHPERGVGPEALADLLFFPTGGGKTEAYLGLSAYTLALRRLQGTIAGRVGDEGVAVLMRYTLRLLTIQQFQRATALICACESIRRKALEHGDARWGKTPFRIGLWVGRRTTPNRTDDAVEAIKQARGNQFGGGGIGTPYQLTACPWCGSAIEAGKHLDAQPYPHGAGRTLTYCGDKFGQCLFSKRQAANEGLPVVVVDEEIYRRLPTLLIATVDKFAQMPWRGEVQMLFGQVNGRCDRHGFKSPEIEDSTSHPKSKFGLPSARLQEHPPLRPPDLIIQDELHLISGPLGTLVGLYETAIDKLCTWEVNGKRVRPKVIASTATIKNADVQVRSLFLRTVNIFPPPGLDVRDNFFSVQREPTETEFGRRYLGICAPGRRLKAALIRVYTAYLCSAQSLYEKYGKQVDPWMTLVGYFNSMRELGGMRRLVDDDVFSRCRKQDRRGLAKRFFNGDYLAELTSRMRSEDIPQILDRLEAVFAPDLEAQRKEAFKAKDYRNLPKKPLDVLLATNMISVGVDVKRLGLMIVAGQPKATAEYIQATSRVGRTFPGLVCTVFNWARPRDLSHYETFEHYHTTFYKHVEPLSVTPFSPGALHRGLPGLLVSLVRLRGVEFNSNEAAARVTMGNPYVQDAIETIAKRAELIGLNGVADGDYCRRELNAMADYWQLQAQDNTAGRTLTYTEPYGSDGPKRGTTVKLLQSPGMEHWPTFTCLNSLREVEPSVKFIISDGGLDEVSSEAGTEPTAAAAPADGEQA